MGGVAEGHGAIDTGRQSRYAPASTSVGVEGHENSQTARNGCTLASKRPRGAHHDVRPKGQAPRWWTSSGDGREGTDLLYHVGRGRRIGGEPEGPD